MSSQCSLGSKRCTSCKLDKCVDQFYKKLGKPVGRCKTCWPNRQYNLKRNHGMTEAQWDVLWDVQQGRCAICHREMIREQRGRGNKMANVAVVDHDHETGRRRGLLCYSCNMAIGMLQDSPKICISAAEYLASNARFSRL